MRASGPVHCELGGPTCIFRARPECFAVRTQNGMKDFTDCCPPAMLGYGGNERPGSDEVLGGLSEGVASGQDHSQKQQSHSAQSELAHPLHGSSPFVWGVEEMKTLSCPSPL